MPSENFARLLAAFKDLTDESRMKIVGLLADRERNVKELSELIGLTEPTVSHHLARLSKHGLVSMRAAGTTHLYSFNRNVLQRFRRDLFSTLLSAEHVTSLVAGVHKDAFERKVFRTYVDGERITQVPTVRKKRDVLLRWLAKDFDEGTEYTEKQVNAVIRKHHPDTAFLRREMIGLRLLDRERDGGVYWRPTETGRPSRRSSRTRPAARPTHGA